MGRFPLPASPAGWFCVAEDADIARGEARPLMRFGRELVAFRGADGAVHLLDAHCPHRGAHLGYGGIVEGDTLRCPLCAWCFDGASGACVEAPGASAIPEGAALRTWPVREWQGLVLAWHHPAGAPPAWEPDLPHMDPGRWHRHGQRIWEVRTHVQEIGENGLDTAHVSAVHGVTLDEVPSVEMEDLRTEGPRMELSTRAVGSLTGTIRRVLWGLGLSMNEFVGPVATRVFITRTPLADERVEMRMVFFVQRLSDADATRKLGEIFASRVATEVEQDIPIWEHKAYLERPVLCEGDGPIGAWRRWAAQFYPDPR